MKFKFLLEKNELIKKKDVKLVETKGTKKRGGGLGGESWKIIVNKERVGIIFINLINEKPIGEHASIQIFLNKKNQGRKIGRFAYEIACEESEYDIIYAHIRKTNIASIKAAEYAGFEDVTPKKYRQIIMRWKRK